MIREVVMYQAVCDGCGKADDQSDHVAWVDTEQATWTAVESGFLVEIGDRLLCADCWTWSDDEESIVERPSAEVPA